MITAEYGIQLSAIERAEPHSNKSKNERNKGSVYYVRAKNVQKNGEFIVVRTGHPAYLQVRKLCNCPITTGTLIF